MKLDYWYFILIGFVLAFVGLLGGVRAKKLASLRFVVGGSALLAGLVILAFTAYKIALIDHS